MTTLAAPPIPPVPKTVPTVSGTVLQTDIPSPFSGAAQPPVYVSGPCSGICANSDQSDSCTKNPGDWPIQAKSCSATCPNQVICVVIDPSVCPKMTGNTYTPVASWTSTQPVAPNVTLPSKSVTCTYDASVFVTSTANVSSYFNTFGATTDYNTKIMPTFCVQSSKNCPVYGYIPNQTDPTSGLTNLVGGPAPTCSNFVDTGTAGTLCQNWATANQSLALTAAAQYCGKNETRDCDCYNRTLDSNYELVAKPINANNISDNCWYIPCKLASTTGNDDYLLPSGLIDKACPSNICQQLTTIVNQGGTVTIGPETGSIDCTSSNSNNSNSTNNNSSTTGGGGTGGTTGGGNGSGVVTPSDTASSWSKYKWLFIGIGILVIVIVIIFVVLNSRKKKIVPKGSSSANPGGTKATPVVIP